MTLGYLMMMMGPIEILVVTGVGLLGGCSPMAGEAI